MKLRTLLRKLALSAGVLVALLVAAELVARWAEPGPMSLLDRSPYVEDARLNHVHEPGFEGRWDSSWYDINSRGWRGPEAQPTFAPDELRVVALGDSCTFGKGVVEADTWPRQLEALLRAELGPERSVHVFNLGVNGYSLWQYERVLQQTVDELKPQLVIVGYNVNDYESVANQADKLVFSTPAGRGPAATEQGGGESGRGGEQLQGQSPKQQPAPQQQTPPPAPPEGGEDSSQRGGPRVATPPGDEPARDEASALPAPRAAARPRKADAQPSGLRARLRALLPRSLRDSLNRSALYRFLRATYYERSREQDYRRLAEIVRQLAAQDPAQRERVLQREGGYLHGLAETARTHDAQVVLFLFPFEAMVVVEDFDRDPEDFVHALAEREGIPYVDVLEAFREHLRAQGGDERLFIRGDRYHPNRKGYAIVARTLLQALQARGLLGPGQ